ncbi:hypothetical protein [Geopsychrobacter electrodiphilus]|uniref:hypothetical protein n=1 Tax=Geopsychrobacter electrodiphilus TaxID=225196 RepID=UPI000363D496|nr:hypothetical protein [Geopsychrobacter electrodiphilus]
MSTEVKQAKVIISAETAKAEADLKRLQRTGTTVTDRLSGDFQTLGIRSSYSMLQQRQNIESSYKRILSSGTVTGHELVRVEQAKAKAMSDIDRQMFGERTSALDSFKQHWLGVTAAIVIANRLASQAWGSLNEAAKADQAEKAFTSLAASSGHLGDQILADLKRVSAGTVDTATMVQKAGTAMTLGIPAEKLSELMEIARVSSRITGQSVAKSFEDISLAVARVSPKILDNLGIIVKVGDANERYAKTLGKTADQLTSNEQKEAFLQEAIIKGQEIIHRVGVETESSSEKMQALSAAASDTSSTFFAMVGNSDLAAGSLSETTRVLIAMTTAFKDLDSFLTESGAGEMLANSLKSVANSMPGLWGMLGMVSLLEKYQNRDMAGEHIKIPARPEQPKKQDFGGNANPYTNQQDGQADAMLEAYNQHLQYLTDTERAEMDANQQMLDLRTEYYTSRTEQDYAHYQWAKDLREQEAAEKLASEQQTATIILNSRLELAAGLANIATIIAGNSKAAALAALILTKGVAMANIFINTQEAAAAALAPPPLGLGPIAGAALSVAIETAGYTRMGLVGLTGLAQAATSGGGGGNYGGGTPSNPVVTQPNGNSQASQAMVVTVNVHGDIVDYERWTETTMAPIIRDLAQSRGIDFGFTVNRS